MKTKDQVLIWEDSSGCHIYDAPKGTMIITATPKGMKKIVSKNLRYDIKTYPFSHEILKAIGDAAMVAKKEGVFFSIVIQDSMRSEIGFAAFKDGYVPFKKKGRK